MIFYFSGTGNSEGIARILAQQLEDQAINIVGADPEAYNFSPEDQVGFVFPVYGYVAPAIMLDFAKKYALAEPTPLRFRHIAMRQDVHWNTSPKQHADWTEALASKCRIICPYLAKSWKPERLQ